ncbi:hypothetical protein WOSG25_012230 [Weissella oryzae SG25]|uniref:Uncharacterized protein n=1 Tax=Weissella oryzae (strain DSM 25784 / JCM 18191 / LMG 30913 / SG25) TaxID=1329250 RepID=A0A069CYF0_WEIOS|nr:hypothetical protein [Weissella oryzae]GAK30126.1 hypothetical protein WOSG25_012230 [Weissella oryzae SG25]
MFNLVFPVDNGMLDGMSGTQLVAKYSLSNRKLIWKDRIETKEAAERLVYIILGLLPLSSPLFMIPMLSLMNHTNKFNILDVFGYRNTILLPIVIGMILEIIFHIYLSKLFSKLGHDIEQPSLDVRIKYITEMIDVSFRKNLTGDSFPPYLVTGSAIGSLLLIIPLVYYLLTSDINTIANIIGMLIILGVLWFTVFFMLFEGIIRTIIMVKFEKKWTKELEQEKRNGK